METMHNKWIQHFGNIEQDLYIVTFDDLVRAFMQSTNYAKYLEGGHSRRGRNKNELKLKTSMRNCDPHKLAIVVTATKSGLSCIILEKEEVFGSCKW